MTAESWSSYQQRVMRAAPALLLVSLLLAAVVYAVLERRGPVHEVHFSYVVSLAEREPADEFRFDGYYALQATDLFTATLAAWLGSPEVIAAAYAEAGLPFAEKEARELVRAVRAEKAAPQLVRVTVREQTAARAAALAAGTVVAMERQVTAYHDQGTPQLVFRAVPSEPWPAVTRASSGVAAVATFVLALFLLVNGVLLWHSVTLLPRE